PVTVIVNPKPLLSSTHGPLTTCSGDAFVYIPTNYVDGTTYTWTRAHVAGIAPATGSGTGNIHEVLVDSTLAPKTVTYVFTMTANGCPNKESITVIVNP